MEYLSAADTAPLLLLEQEIEKLYVYGGKRRIWTKADVEAVFSSLPEVSRFALLTAIAQKDPKRWNFCRTKRNMAAAR